MRQLEMEYRATLSRKCIEECANNLSLQKTIAYYAWTTSINNNESGFIRRVKNGECGEDLSNILPKYLKKLYTLIKYINAYVNYYEDTVTNNTILKATLENCKNNLVKNGMSKNQLSNFMEKIKL